ncbi:MAG TPA: hypothetical protein VKW78_05195 [Terriglobales bacterium]|nr:hypothetical protein [Terriglobales bacterium]
MRKLCIVLFVLVIFNIVSAQNLSSANLHADYYSAAEQFSPSENPNGTWTYGYSKRLGSRFNPLTTAGGCNCADEYNGWYGPSGPGSAPMIVTSSGLAQQYAIKLQASSNTTTVLRWTAPSSGKYDLIANFYGVSGGSTIAILVENRIRFQDIISAANDRKWSWLTFRAAQGDTVDFVVGSKGDLTDSGVLLQAMIRTHNYRFEVIDPPGSRWTITRRINNLGAIAGAFRDNQGVYHGFVLHKGNYIVIDYQDPEGEFVAGGTYALGINDWGQVVGYAFSADYTTVRSFLWQNGKFKNITVPGLTNVGAQGINNWGEIVGYSDTNAFLLQRDGKWLSIAPPEISYYPSAEVVTTFGKVGGNYYDQDFWIHSFVRDTKGNYSDISFPGATDTVLYGMNDWGVISGRYFGGPVCAPDYSYGQSFMKVGARYLPIWVPGQISSGVDGLNNFGVITGLAIDVNGIGHGFIGIPDTE